MGRGRARGGGGRARRPPRPDPQRWKKTALIAAAVVAILSPVVKLAVEVGERALASPAGEERVCRPAWPPPWQPPS